MKIKLNKFLLKLLFCCLMFAVSTVDAQTDTLKVFTSAKCSTCKVTLEKNLNFEKGVSKATLNMDDKIITIIYNPKKTTPAKLRKAISDSGYDADSIPANPKAFDKLKACCKTGEH